jgi:chromate reductase
MPPFHIQFEPGLITDEGEVTSPETAEFLPNYLNEFHGFMGRCYMVLPRNVQPPAAPMVDTN